MGTKAFLQKGRTKPGLVLPANAVERVNQANDRSALVRAAEAKSPPAVGNVGMTSSAKLTVTRPEKPDVEATAVAGMSSGAQPEVVRNGEVVEPKPVDLGEEIERVTANVSAALGVPAELLGPVEPGTGAVPATMQPHPIEPDPKPKKAGLPADTPLTVVAGIGTALAERFAAYGYATLSDLAKADAETINEIPGARKRGQQWVDEAKKRLDS